MTDQPLPSYETAFIIMRSSDGAWHVTGDFSTGFETKTPPSRQDVRIGCKEIITVLEQQDLAAIVGEVVSQLLEQNSQTDSQRISASMRDAVSRRKSAE